MYIRTGFVSGGKMDAQKDTLVSGIQPSGTLHIGNYVGAIRNWARLQDTYESFFFIADLHAITAPYKPETMPDRIMEMAVGLLAAGVDPDKSALFVQSQVPQHVFLAWLFNTVTPMGDLFRMTQYKDKSNKIGGAIKLGLFAYPVLQAADIALYGGSVVPVGEDQLQHVELSREVVRRFNRAFGPTFPEPKALLSTAPRIMGMDGKSKMSKSLNNYVGLLDDSKAIWDKLRPAVTDPARVRRTDPGDPEKCNIYTMHKAFSPPDIQKEVAVGCKQGSIGCVDCKRTLLKHVNAGLAPIRERAEYFNSRPDEVRDILACGRKKAGARAEATMDKVVHKMGLYLPENKTGEGL